MKKKSFAERGQALVLIALGMAVMLLMAGLILDGGQAYTSRRAAQTAADAGALAGAHEKCNGAGAGAAPATAINYATIENEASNATAYVDGTTGEVVVNTTISQQSFFSQLFGSGPVIVEAEARANCLAAESATNALLPVAWSCRPPVTGHVTIGEDCDIKGLDWETQLKPLITGSPATVEIEGIYYSTPWDFSNAILPQVYVMMDSNPTKFDIKDTCQPAGEMPCDLSDPPDGIIDIVGNGDRSWLDLDGGGGGASSLSDWIRNGYDDVITIHTWLEGENGTKTSVFFSVDNYMRYEVVTVPVFNAFCPGDPINNNACQNAAHAAFPLAPGETDTPPPGGARGNRTYFHIVGFANFFITCVDTGNDDCPGHDAAADELHAFGRNTKTIEGYFVDNYPMSDNPQVGAAGADAGINIVSLTR